MPGRLAVDFGTSNTVLALWDPDRKEASTYAPAAYRSLYPQGGGTTKVVPSLIHYGEDQRQWLGQQVLQRNLLKHPHTLRWAKRYIGRGGTSPIKRCGPPFGYFLGASSGSNPSCCTVGRRRI